VSGFAADMLLGGKVLLVVLLLVANAMSRGSSSVSRYSICRQRTSGLIVLP